MKGSTTILILSLLLIAFLFFSCKDQAGNDSAIEIIKQSETGWEGTITWEKFLTNVAGLEGNISWKAVPLNGNNSQLRVVEVNIIKNRNGRANTVKIQWQVNIETRFNKISYFDINGIPQSLQSGMYAIEIWSIEN